MKRLLPWMAIAGLSIALIIPAALGSVRLNDSFWIDWVWLDQFADQLRHGTLFPRWLPYSHGGLGSPVFYYYPPLAFFIGSAFVFAGLSTYAGILGIFFVGILLSGIAMFLWLREETRSPLTGALLFMAMPYQMFDFYLRGAAAEFIASAIIPLVMLGLLHLAQGRRRGFFIAAISYAALIASHLPLALLASIFLVGPYSLLLSRRKGIRTLLSLAAALGTGIVLASIYLLPALELEPYRDAANLWRNPVLQPDNWTFWKSAPSDPQTYRAVLIIIASLALPSFALLISRRSSWALAALATALIAAGAIPAIWSLPLLRSVQFPFRLLPVSEFALATAVAFAQWRNARSMIWLVPLLLLSVVILRASPRPNASSLAELQRIHPDVPENLPPGERPYSWPSRWALAVAAGHRAPEIEAGVTTEPIFFFPTWRVSCAGTEVPTFPDPQTKLLSYRGHGCTPELVWSVSEKVGSAISLFGLIVLAGWALLTTSWRLRTSAEPRKGARQEETT